MRSFPSSNLNHNNKIVVLRGKTMNKLKEIEKLVNSLEVFTPYGSTCSWVNPEKAAEVVEKIREILRR